MAFVSNGSILPRAQSCSDAPAINAVPFQSPKSLEAEFHLPHAGIVRGMLIPVGVTIITGGGFHGKSTLLKAIACGVYDKVPGDGREFVVAIHDSCVIRAEDGR